MVAHGLARDLIGWKPHSHDTSNIQETGDVPFPDVHGLGRGYPFEVG